MVGLMQRVARLRREGADRGFTLIELLVSSLIFSIVLGIMTSAIVLMLKTSDKAQGQAADLTQGNRVIEQLDKQVSYASAISNPGIGTDGNFYVEYLNATSDSSGNLISSCTQWRYVSSPGSLQWRTWTFNSSNTITQTATNWATAASGVTADGSNPVFSISPTNTSNDKEQLTVDFKVTNGVPPQTSQFLTTLTAVNTRSAAAPTAACTQYGRP